MLPGAAHTWSLLDSAPAPEAGGTAGSCRARAPARCWGAPTSPRSTRGSTPCTETAATCWPRYGPQGPRSGRVASAAGLGPAHPCLGCRQPLHLPPPAPGATPQDFQGGRGGREVGWRLWAEGDDPCLQPCNGSVFTVLAELRRCGLTDSETCLRSLTLSLGGGRTVSADVGWGSLCPSWQVTSAQALDPGVGGARGWGAA